MMSLREVNKESLCIRLPYSINLPIISVASLRARSKIGSVLELWGTINGKDHGRRWKKTPRYH